ncbi:site-specific integrase [Agaribacterium sp. ZY112]|uniref:site-specific integrase n=1 Tax=Agaribacterium sp. ZY112 TaxID=3233574 RepID=UPI003525F3BA
MQDKYHSTPLPARTIEGQLPQQPDDAKLQQYVHAATSDNTRKTYRSAIRQFERWGGLLPTDVPTLLRYLLDKAEQANPRTLDLHLTAIAQWHHTQRFRNPVDDPQIKKTMEGIRRIHGRPKQKAKALRLEHIVAMVAHLQAQPASLKGARDLALLLIGFFGAFRRSELVGIQWEDLTWEDEGLLVQLPKSKTDQSGEGQVRALPFGHDAICPGTALQTWLKQSDITSGPVFQSMTRWGQLKGTAMNPGAVNELLKQLGTTCQFEFVPDLSAHSLRRGLSTSAAREDIPFELIKKQGGWRSDATVWGYIEEGKQLEDNANTSLLAKANALLKKT